jgi:uncharacterized protein with FMN-binding domain
MTKDMPRLSRRIRVAAVAGLSASAAIAGCSTAGTEVTSGPTTGETVYADGSYTATGVYGGLPSSIYVSVTLDDGVIAAVDVTPHATNPISRDYQERFADVIPALVVGKPIDEANVSRVAGSSGTPDGFNAALEQIRRQASN